MKYLFCLVTLFILNTNISAQSATGTWVTVDDEDGTPKSYVTIYEENGKVYGKIKELIDSGLTLCEDCKGDKKDQPIEGMQIIWDLEQSGTNAWGGGKILDPGSGKEYKCNLKLENENTLNVRGFIGISLLGRTQTWFRVND